MSNIINTQIDSAKDKDVVMPTYNLKEYNGSYSEALIIVWKYYRDQPSHQIVISKSFISKIKITGKTPTADNRKDIEIAIPLTYYSNIWKTLVMPLINCEISLVLT